MADIDLTQAEADSLFAMEKIRVDDSEWDLPDLGGKLSVPLISPDKKEHFLIDVSRGSIDLQRQKYQNRTRETIILARMCMGRPHRNPPELGGNEVGVPHLHLYREGFADRWACELPAGVFSNLNDPWQILNDFMRFCKITEAPLFRRGLFS